MNARTWVGIAGFLVLLGTTAACSGTSSTSPPSPSSSPSTVAYSPTNPTAANITADWQEFFSGATPASRKIELLQNGGEFADIIRAQANSPMAKGAGVKVSAVDLSSPTTATVEYSIVLNGQVALANQTGRAVLEAGTWKVGDTSFCALLALEGQTVPSCPSTAPSASPTA